MNNSNSSTICIDLDTYSDRVFENDNDINDHNLQNLFNKTLIHHQHDDDDERVDEKKMDMVDSRLIYFALAGSQSFNLHQQDSDQDFIGVREANIEDVLSLRGVKETIHHLKPDITIYELRHYAKLLLLGNPRQIESLYTDKFSFQSEEWKRIIEKKKEFITMVTIDHYLSTIKALLYGINSKIKKKQEKEQRRANGQEDDKKKEKSKREKRSVENNKVQTLLLEKKKEKQEMLMMELESRQTVHKKAYHASRLLSEVKRMIDGLEPIVQYTDDSQERERLLEIRKGDFNHQEMQDQLNKQFNEMEQARNQMTNSYSQEVDIKMVSDWLVSIRRQSINRYQGYRYSWPNGETEKSESLRLQAKQLMQKHGIIGELIYVGESGSNLYHLDKTMDSEQDIIGIYASSTDEIVSLLPPPTRLDVDNISPNLEYIPRNNINSSKSTSPPPSAKKDITTKGMILYEVGQAIQQLIHGHYRLYDCLLADNTKYQSYQSPAWKDLVAKIMINNNHTIAIDNNHSVDTKFTNLFNNRIYAQNTWGIAQGEYLRARILLGLKKPPPKLSKKKQMKLEKRIQEQGNQEEPVQEKETIGPNVTFQDKLAACRCFYIAFRLLWLSKSILQGNQINLHFDDNETTKDQKELLLLFKYPIKDENQQSLKIRDEELVEKIDECRELIESLILPLETFKVFFRSDDIENQLHDLFNPWLIKIRLSM
ncbi:hypothetical protein DFA_08353 [Cavenderia fasciculata]|uniref:Uncharacterized protein n=1 Tax=Cavenderia fasciculata TaxID=261658 RepID=F4Q5U9_CACFS|nr:uncharacterized protein DFA_08353 [Cavenderia fasciculata]EGG17358.1 hypothetical protein DFA_08353 [Cavenderia fasciculata]|eukprot:XP_004355842.1 hypothetical protein DFA_08353 [Cavenderia fasciculata]